ncbi:hypothetical protein [Desulfomicrobium norvegicum]|nr:hypothetical protein [Desulfomicrobium norvegicum]
MAVGEKYSRLLSFSLNHLRGYAKKCGTDLIVCDEAPDQKFRRSLLSQKLLLPKRYSSYDWIFFVDLDVLISTTAPSVFDCVDDSFAFSASVDNRESKKTALHVWRRPDILEETHRSYFTSRGFQDSELLHGSINGGAFLCRPSVIGKLFEDAYWSDLPETSHEEAIAAYVSQTKGLFKPLDDRFNTQVLHALSAEDPDYAYNFAHGYHFKILKKLHSIMPPALLKSLYPRVYSRFVSDKMKENYILHFAGGYPFLGLPNG